MKRDLMDTTKDYRIERFLLKFLSKPLSAMGLKRQQLLEKTEREFEEIRNDVFEKQILRIFDFTAWVESLLRKTTLSEVLHNRSNTHNTHNIRA
jgi:hypothetical protein